MHVYVKGRHLLLEEDPHYLVVAFVASPVKWRVLAYLLGIFRFHKWIVDLFACEAYLGHLLRLGQCWLLLVLVEVRTAGPSLD
jgi:hypothetical protein